MFNQIKKEIKKAINDNLSITISLDDLELEIPNDKSNGDLATNIAFKIAGKVKRSPQEIAREIADSFKSQNFSVQDKNGFINFTFSDQFLTQLVNKTIKFKRKKKEKTMVLDYSAPNIAKPFGIGHLRSTIVGQAIYNIYNFSGWHCVGVNHLGDWGTQYGKLIRQIVKSNENPENLSIKDLERLYVQFHKEANEDPEIVKEGRKWFKKLEEGDEKARKIWKTCVRKSMEEFNKTYTLLGVDIDHNIGESFYQDKIKDVIKETKEKGVAKESEGALIIDFGDEMPPAMLLKSNGGTTYFSRDLATVKYRLNRWNPDLFIYEIGADQKLHMKQLFKTVEMLGWAKKEDFMHVAHGMYRLKDGAMSTRKGKTVHLEDVLDKAVSKATDIINKSNLGEELSVNKKEKIARKIGVGAVKYADLKKHFKRDIVFDWEKVMSLKGDSGPYLQYTTLRAKSVLEKAKKDKEDFKIDQLSAEERDLLSKIIEFDQVVEIAKDNFTPSTIANFAYQLAKKFNLFYAQKPILNAKNEKLEKQRLFITEASFKVLEKSLSLLGIALPERM